MMLSAPTYVIGIDPGFSATGLVTLKLWPEAGLIHCHVLGRETIRTAASRGTGADRVPVLIARRVASLFLRLDTYLDGAMRNRNSPTVIVVEDPTDFKAIPFARRGTQGGTQKDAQRSPKSIATLGAAYGVVLSVATQYEAQTVTVPSNVWYPRGFGGGHKLKHAHAREHLRTRYPALGCCTDDETFAAGVACWWAWNLAT